MPVPDLGSPANARAEDNMNPTNPDQREGKRTYLTVRRVVPFAEGFPAIGGVFSSPVKSSAKGFWYWARILREAPQNGSLETVHQRRRSISNDTSLIDI